MLVLGWILHCWILHYSPGDVWAERFYWHLQYIVTLCVSIYVCTELCPNEITISIVDKGSIWNGCKVRVLHIWLRTYCKHLIIIFRSVNKLIGYSICNNIVPKSDP